MVLLLPQPSRKTLLETPPSPSSTRLLLSGGYNESPLPLPYPALILRAIILFAAVLCACSASSPDTLFGTSSFFARLYSDQKAAKPGDILHIIIAERATASHVASRDIKRDTTTKVGPGQGWLDFFKMLGFRGSHKSGDSAKAVRSGTLTARVTVRVVERLPNGNLLVEGRHKILVNKDEQTITIRGEVRPRDINADNTVYSYNVANLQIEYHGSDPGRPGRRTGILTRLLNLLF